MNKSNDLIFMFGLWTNSHDSKSAKKEKHFYRIKLSGTNNSFAIIYPWAKSEKILKNRNKEKLNSYPSLS